MQALMLIDEYGLGSDSNDSDKGKAKKWEGAKTCGFLQR